MYRYVLAVASGGAAGECRLKFQLSCRCVRKRRCRHCTGTRCAATPCNNVHNNIPVVEVRRPRTRELSVAAFESCPCMPPHTAPTLAPSSRAFVVHNAHMQHSCVLNVCAGLRALPHPSCALLADPRAACPGQPRVWRVARKSSPRHGCIPVWGVGAARVYGGTWRRDTLRCWRWRPRCCLPVHAAFTHGTGTLA